MHEVTQLQGSIKVKMFCCLPGGPTPLQVGPVAEMHSRTAFKSQIGRVWLDLGLFSLTGKDSSVRGEREW